MIRPIFYLVLHDLAVAVKNKSLFLICAMPILIWASLTWVDESDSATQVASHIALVRGVAYPAGVVSSIESAPKIFSVEWVDSEEEGRLKLREKKYDGLLLPSSKLTNGCTLLVPRRESIQTLAILQGLSALQKIARKNEVDWVEDVKPLIEGGVQKQSLTTWILMTSLLVGFIILPTQVAEEREKKQTLGLFQTPLSEHQWLCSKLIVGLILMLVAAILFHTLNEVPIVSLNGYLVFFVLGAFYFCSAGLVLGLLCKTQASARAFGVLLYLPHLLPSALADFSRKMSSVAQFIPSYRFYEPLKTMLLTDAEIKGFTFEMSYLLLAGAVCYVIAYVLLRNRARFA